jgi:hypothetical protein
MVEQLPRSAKEAAAEIEERAIQAARKAKKYLLNQDILAVLKQQQKAQRQQARKFTINLALLEANGKTWQGAKITGLSMNEATLELPFSPPYLSLLTLTFALGELTKVFTVVGRVSWSRVSLPKGWYEVGVQFFQNYWEIDFLLRLGMR